MICSLCKNQMSTQEEACYGNRCENCWSDGSPGNFLRGLPSRRASTCYSPAMIGSASEISNRGTIAGGANKFFKGRKVRKQS